MKSWPRPILPTVSGNHAEPVRVFDTATSQLQVVATGPSAGIYVCGITPYDATHLGHAATYLAFDLLVRQLLDAGVQVSFVQNVTDVDDPLLERAEQTGVDWRELAADQIELYREDMAALRVLPPQHFIGAVESVDQVAGAVARMLKESAAYEVPALVDGRPSVDIYADLSVDGRFGSLAHLPEAEMDQLFAERGGDPERSGKRHPLDPLLWRAARPGEPSWDGGALGWGRPGWHIECAVIAADFLQAPFEVQGGGRDLIFPHHEMSASHMRCLQDPPARLAMHTGLVGLDGEKMSKSLGNLVLVSQLRAAGHDPAAIRLAIIGQPYRADWQWRAALLTEAETRLETWRRAAATTGGPGAEETIAAVRAALRNNLDTPAAIGVLDRWAAQVESGDGRDLGSTTEWAQPQVAAAIDALLGIEL